MERLTKWLNDKKNLCIKECEKECVEKHTECHKCEPFKDVMKRLADYEDAEEQGLLLRLPCKVGDTVYTISIRGKKEINISKIRDVQYRGICYAEGQRFFINASSLVYTESDIGKYLFLTQEEAEQELANRQQSHAEAIMDERNGRVNVC